MSIVPHSLSQPSQQSYVTIDEHVMSEKIAEADPLLHFDAFEDLSMFGGLDAELDHVDEDEEIVVNDTNTDSSSEENEEMDEDSDEDSEYIVDEANLQYDVDVDMSEFHSAVDDDEHGILKKPSTNAQCENVEEELEVIETDNYQFAGFAQDERKRMLKDLSKYGKCSHGEIHKKACRVGQTFKSKEDVKAYIDLHSVESRRSLYLAKNDKIRIRVKCKGVVGESSQSCGTATRSKVECKGKTVIDKKSSCPWAVQISRSNEDEAWMVKTVTDEHKCLQTRVVKACTAKFLASSILPKIHGNPKVPVKALHEELSTNFQLGMSKQKVARAKTMAEQILSGDYKVQYGLLRDYVTELKNCNPDTTVKINVYPEASLSSTTRTFRRIYICLGSLKLGFKAGLRDFLGVDGTFMNGPYPGQILTAVGLDSNNGIFHVAYTIVEAETCSSWTWFLELLGEDLDLRANSNFTFISDRQKGILPALAKVFPSAEHRFCLRHIMENMKLKFRGSELQEQLWACGRATTINHFNRAMETFKKMNDKAYTWLCQIAPSHWSKAHLTGRARTDCLLNNLCEVFNSKIDGGRDKPIITCLEYIREYLMKRLCIVQTTIDKCQGLLTPSATEVFEKIKLEASDYKAIFNGAGKYQVTCPWKDQFVVNLNQRTCSCRSWEVSGFPCKHAMCAIWDNIENGGNSPCVEEWMDPCYRMSTWKAMYFNKIEPINGRSMWPKIDSPITLNPPKHHTQVGRQKKKKRKKGIDESSSQPRKLSRKYLTVTCAKCHNKGHNSRTCKGQGGKSQSSQIGGKGKKMGAGTSA